MWKMMPQLVQFLVVVSSAMAVGIAGRQEFGRDSGNGVVDELLRDDDQKSRAE
jgi:hypothetical protein